MLYIFIIIAVIAGIISLIYNAADSGDAKSVICSIIGVLAFILYVWSSSTVTKQNSYYRSLEGKNPYEMIIQYELEDSFMIVSDTIFRLKIKEK